MTTVIICGGRNYDDVPKMFRALDVLDEELDIRFVVDGASDDVTGPYVGADYWAHQWAVLRGKQTVRVHAKWQLHGKLAGPFRNQKMLDRYKPDLVIYFPGGAGTDSMIKLAKKAGVKTRPAFSWMRKKT